MTQLKNNEWSEEELDVVDEMERQWRMVAPRYSLHELLVIFPEARDILKESIPMRIASIGKEYQQARAELSELTLIMDYVPKTLTDMIARCEKSMSELRYCWAVVKGGTRVGGEMSDKKERALRVPITSILTGFNRSGFRKCLWHSEKSSSMKLYKDKDGKERVWCFGCNHGGDVIAVVMYQQSVSFMDAVSLLSKVNN